MLVVLHFSLPADGEVSFRERAETALSALAARPGFRSGRLGRAIDDASSWMLLTEWEGVGAWRRALSSYDVKVTATSLLAEALNDPSAFEVLYLDDGTGVRRHESDRADDADTTGPVP